MYIRAKINRKIKRFNKEFNKEEKIVIILGSLVTIIGFIMGIVLFFKVATTIFNWYIDLTAPYVREALNKLVGALLPGWKMF